MWIRFIIVVQQPLSSRSATYKDARRVLVFICPISFSVLTDCSSHMEGNVVNESDQAYRIKGLNYVSFFVEDLPKVVEFYTKVLGEPQNVDPGEIYGWRTGNTWMTIFPSGGAVAGSSFSSGNPRNTVFMMEVESSEDVDRLYAAFIGAGATNAGSPENSTMYEYMRVAFVKDPFGMQIGIYCPLREGG